jgi:hypothetical protein
MRPGVPRRTGDRPRPTQEPAKPRDAQRARAATGVPPTADDATSDREGFDEERYLKAFPDIAEAVSQGIWESGQAHYSAHGAGEGRLISPEYLGALPVSDSDFPPCHIDSCFITPTGWCLIIGWIDDQAEPLRAVGWNQARSSRISCTSVVTGTRRVRFPLVCSAGP